MHWIEKFRKEYISTAGKRGLSQEGLAKMVRRRGVGCSAALIDLLENQRGGITHPRIADKIAEVCNATQEQRDGIVHKMHWGGWRRPGPRRRKEFETRPQPLTVGILPETARAVVAIDTAGMEIERYDSIHQAARATGVTDTTVSKRCNRKISANTYEFFAAGCTFRFAEEWDAMSTTQRDEDMLAAALRKRRLT